MGSSIVRNAFLHARHTYEGPNLNMNRYGYTKWWQGKWGLKWRDLVPRLVFLSNFESPPSVLVIHCGGNSIGQTPLFDLRAEINFSLKQIKVFMYFAGFCFKFAIYNICHDWWVQDVTRKASVSDTTSAGMHIGPFSPFTWFTESLLSGPVTIHNTFIDINGQQYLWGL